MSLNLPRASQKKPAVPKPAMHGTAGCHDDTYPRDTLNKPHLAGFVPAKTPLGVQNFVPVAYRDTSSATRPETCFLPPHVRLMIEPA